MTFNESNVRRDADGRFDEKPQTEPEAALPAPLHDPWENFPVLPTSHTEAFAGANTFAEVDEVARTLPNDVDARWAAVNRGRELRRAGAAGVPSMLDDRHPFRHAQNDPELEELFELATEELHADGMNSMAVQNRLRADFRWQATERRAELLEAGVAVHRSFN